MTLLQILIPEIVLLVAAGALFLFGISSRAATRRIAPWVALAALVLVFVSEFFRSLGAPMEQAVEDAFKTVRLDNFSHFIKLLTSGVGAMLVLLAWPTDDDFTGNRSLHFGEEAGEFFALMLCAIAGVFLVAGASDLLVLFLGIELASIPTYVMVSMSRPLPAAQEAGLKYFFLGAFSAAIMLFGFSYLYGVTGETSLAEIGGVLGDTVAARGETVAMSGYLMLGAIMLIAGFAFKMAAVPLHFYAGDVYEGAATPVTAYLSFVPKITGFIALIKVLHALGGGAFAVDTTLVNLLWALAFLSMTIGNLLGLLQTNVKRVLAYSSIAHSGYMLVGVTVLAGLPGNVEQSQEALRGVLFYLTAYGIMNVAAFGVLQLLPSRSSDPATSAETYEDLAGQGRKHPALGLAMAVAMFSLIGLPLTIGFWGKLYLIWPALQGGFVWLAILTFVNAAISAAYYLRIVAAMFLRTDDVTEATPGPETSPAHLPRPIVTAVAISTFATLLFGTVLPLTQLINVNVDAAAKWERRNFAIPNLEGPAANLVASDGASTVD